MRISKVFRSSAIATVASAALIFAPLAPAWAVTNSWGVWSGDESASGNLTFSANMVNATWTLSGGEEGDIRASSSRFFNASTPVGSIFGSNATSVDSSYNYNRVSDSSTLTVTFASAVPAGTLGFAISDVDNDQVQVSAFDANDTPLTGAQIIGTASDVAFNFCLPATDRPSSCADGTYSAQTIPSVTTNGNEILVTRQIDDDENGSSAWFRPNVAVKKVVFTQTGGPVDYWFAQNVTPAPTPTPTPTDSPSPAPSDNSSSNQASLAKTGNEQSAMTNLIGIGIALVSAGGVLLTLRRRKL